MPELPDEIARRPFRVDRGRDIGITRADLDGTHFSSPFHGVRAFTAGLPVTLITRIQAAAVLLPPGGAVGGWAAAVLHGAPWFDGEAADGSPLDVPLNVGDSYRRRRIGIDEVREQLTEQDRMFVDGIPVTTPARTCLDLARWAQSDDEAQAAVDSFLRAGLVDAAALLAAMPGRARGVPKARRAVAAGSPRAESPRESALRVRWLSAGLPVPLVNVEVFSLDGRLLGRPDLLDPESGLVGEYDGFWHLRRDRRDRDHVRERGFTDSGLTIASTVAADLAGPPARLEHILLSAYDRARQVPPSRRRWRLERGQREAPLWMVRWDDEAAG